MILQGQPLKVFSKQWLAKRCSDMSDEEFIRNRREMFYDKRYEAALETAGEAEQAAATADLNAGPDAGLGGDMGEVTRRRRSSRSRARTGSATRRPSRRRPSR